MIFLDVIVIRPYFCVHFVEINKLNLTEKINVKHYLANYIIRKKNKFMSHKVVSLFVIKWCRTIFA